MWYNCYIDYCIACLQFLCIICHLSSHSHSYALHSICVTLTARCCPRGLGSKLFDSLMEAPGHLKYWGCIHWHLNEAHPWDWQQLTSHLLPLLCQWLVSRMGLLPLRNRLSQVIHWMPVIVVTTDSFVLQLQEHCTSICLDKWVKIVFHSEKNTTSVTAINVMSYNFKCWSLCDGPTHWYLTPQQSPLPLFLSM